MCGAYAIIVIIAGAIPFCAEHPTQRPNTAGKQYKIESRIHCILSTFFDLESVSYSDTSRAVVFSLSTWNWFFRVQDSFKLRNQNPLIYRYARFLVHSLFGKKQHFRKKGWHFFLKENKFVFFCAFPVNILMNFFSLFLLLVNSSLKWKLSFWRRFLLIDVLIKC